MKKNIFGIIIAGLLAMSSLPSCEDYFDDVPNNAMSLEDVFDNRGLTLEWLTNVYSYFPDFTNRYAGGTAMFWGPGTIEGYLPWDWVETHNIIHGTMYPSTDFVNRIWREYYRGIQYANIYLANVDNCERMPDNEKEWTKAECRALRAMFYFNMVKLYGPVPLVGDRIFGVDEPTSDYMLARNTVDECFDYILSELDDVLKSGKLVSQFNEGVYNAQMKGNLTQEAVEGLRSVVLLFRASYLYNGDPYFMNLANTDGTKLFPQSRDEQKWRDALTAAEDIINSGKFKLTYRDNGNKLTEDITKADPFYSIFEASRGSSDNEEMIYGRTSSSNETYAMVPRFGNLGSNYDKGGGAYSVPLEFVDLFFMADGKRIDDENSGYFTYDEDNIPTALRGADAIVQGTECKDVYNTEVNHSYFRIASGKPVMKQFYDREPRFYLNITFQNRPWDFDKSTAVEMEYNGNSGPNGNTHDYPIFGTITRKLYYAKTSNWDMAMVLRLGEVYLNAAEAAAELGQLDKAIDYVNVIRARAGVAEYKKNAGDSSRGARGKAKMDLPAYDQETILKAIYRERILELSYESKHYFDVRRWGVANGTWRGDDNAPQMTDSWIYPAYHKGGEGGEMHGFNVNAIGQTDANKNVIFYKRYVQDTRVFNKRMSLLPIPQTDMYRNDLLVQNPGWTQEETAE